MPDTVLAPSPAPVAPTLVDRALRRVTGLWRDMAERVTGRDEVEDIAAQMQACLTARGGEVSARARAAKLAAAYRGFAEAERLNFLRVLAGFDADPNVLRPHPGLRLEMDRCDGPVSGAYRAFLGKHTNGSLLRQIAFMTSSTAQVQWSFGTTVHNDGRFSPISDPAGDKFDNFSGDVFQFGSTFPFDKSLTTTAIPQLARLFTTELLMADGALTGAAALKAAKASEDLNAVEHPGRVGQGGTNCFSCHMVPQTRNELVNKGVTPTPTGAYPRVTLWPPFDDTLRSTFNFRNFGYGPGFEMGVSRRTANETDDVRRTLNTIFR